VIDSTGKVRVASTERDVWRKCGIPPGSCPSDSFGDYRLGHMPAGGQVTVAVINPHNNRLLASKRLTLAENAADTDVGDLSIDR
jgi:hypothetical protein